MMTRFLVLVVATCCCASAYAQELKIGFVDAVKLVEMAPQGKSSLRALEEEFSPRDREIRRQRSELRRMEADLDKNAPVMKQSDIDGKQREIQQVQRALKRLQEEFKEDYSIRRNEELQKLQRIVTEAIIQIAENENYDLIVQQAVYASPRINITEKVLEKLAQDDLEE